MAVADVKCLGYTKISSLSSATGINPPAGTSQAWVKAETQNVRWRADGNDPTASDGMLLATTDGVQVFRVDLQRLRFIEVTGSAVLHVTYFGINPTS